VTNELVLVDGAPSQDYLGRTVIGAQSAGLDPVHPDPDMLDRVGYLLQNCDRVAIDAPLARRAYWRDALRGIDVEVELIAAELDANGPFELRSIDGHCTMLIQRGGLSPSRRARKRLFDIVLASIAITLLSPLMLAFAIAIVIDSPGPVIFRQRRVGRGNRQFEMFKFRSMRTDVSDGAGRRSTDRGDPRITRVGHLLRRASLDELPQLLNVLSGDMSLVGPRPHALGSLAGGSLFWQIDSGYWDRHAVKPGMTGLAQVRGLRGATSTARDLTLRLRSDIEYIANWSLLSDAVILLRTIRVLIHRNAY
jgi:exopolysaccharide biosynthesis polyprenyl glycosylphosphotransferase